MNMKCRLCIERGKTWDGDDPRCAFPRDVFNTDNWCCATMGELRQLAERHQAEPGKTGTFFAFYFHDESAATIPYLDKSECPAFIVLTWYKDRGRTGRAVVMCNASQPREMTLQDAEECVRYWENA